MGARPADTVVSDSCGRPGLSSLYSGRLGLVRKDTEMQTFLAWLNFVSALVVLFCIYMARRDYARLNDRR